MFWNFISNQSTSQVKQRKTTRPIVERKTGLKERTFTCPRLRPNSIEDFQSISTANTVCCCLHRLVRSNTCLVSFQLFCEDKTFKIDHTFRVPYHWLGKKEARLALSPGGLAHFRRGWGSASIKVILVINICLSNHCSARLIYQIQHPADR
ncbi:hypothetical protein M438DRAFT_90058 [Aureobasidium pullulans EXF-150]|uniref:Uncharacterized protein n=1 Tax=Aureobasidium pullulans EXF-150 TaxID=1043002 RepID=A0A074XT70_AURPU|nr:uncharacterized protein M438DRAFT_90058 [Aureobasidium pullulans EXF-150]KEQ88680.1 hypothetical protein M438DRAFT_90058 [Aureobasidium pullulans EXF-150]